MMEAAKIEIIAVGNIGEVEAGDDIGKVIAGAASLIQDDVLVVTSKIVSKAERRVVDCDSDEERAALVLGEARRVLRRRDELLITETQHGFVCANSGIDLSNVAEGKAALLPLDSDRSAMRIRESIRAESGVEVGVIISDTFGRSWRNGLTDVAIGVCGIAAIVDLRGSHDAGGRELQVTEIAIADELAGAAELVMGKASQCPVAIVRGYQGPRADGRAADLVRRPDEDLFR